MKISEYLKWLNEIGFKEALKIDFVGHEKRNEAMYIFWCAKYGILLRFDTYSGDLNGGQYYYNWLPKDIDKGYEFVSSGGFYKYNDELIWIGSHDCRSNIEREIKKLKKNGKFIVPWIKRPFLWLLHYKDKEALIELSDREWDVVNYRRMHQLSDAIQTAIKGQSDET